MYTLRELQDHRYQDFFIQSDALYLFTNDCAGIVKLLLYIFVTYMYIFNLFHVTIFFILYRVCHSRGVYYREEIYRMTVKNAIDKKEKIIK